MFFTWTSPTASGVGSGTSRYRNTWLHSIPFDSSAPSLAIRQYEIRPLGIRNAGCLRDVEGPHLLQLLNRIMNFTEAWLSVSMDRIPSLPLPSLNVGRAEAGVLLPGASHCIFREMKGA
jgi:hypothetical protein